jgi:hypothetical protein
MSLTIRHCLLALLLIPTSGWAQAEQFHSFAIEDTTYTLMPSSMRMENKLLVALWNVTTPNHSWRWKVHISDCSKPYGTIYTKMDRTERTDEWSNEGLRAYDFLAAYTCVSYILRDKK